MKEKISKVLLIIGLCMLPVFIIAMVLLLFFNNYLPATWAPIVLYQIMFAYYCIMAVMFLLAVIFRRMSTKPVKVFFTIGTSMFLFMIFYLFLALIAPTGVSFINISLLATHIIYVSYLIIMVVSYLIVAILEIKDMVRALRERGK